MYIILAANNKLYTGISKNVERRFLQHLKGQGAKFFRSTTPLKIIYREWVGDHGAALKRERVIKKMNRRQKDFLCLGHMNKE